MRDLNCCPADISDVRHLNGLSFLRNVYCLKLEEVNSFDNNKIGTHFPYSVIKWILNKLIGL